jgi:hypothetical protein
MFFQVNSYLFVHKNSLFIMVDVMNIRRKIGVVDCFMRNMVNSGVWEWGGGVIRYGRGCRRGCTIVGFERVNVMRMRWWWWMRR